MHGRADRTGLIQPLGMSVRRRVAGIQGRVKSVLSHMQRVR
jgi:hypothetical protein